jgi:hypothetical protein
MRILTKFRISHAAATVAVVASTAMIGGIATPALAQQAGAPAPAGVSGHAAAGPDGVASQAAVAGYWTRSRMQSARNASLVSVKPGAQKSSAAPLPSGQPGKIAGARPVQALAGGIRQTSAAARGGGASRTARPDVAWGGNHYLPPATTSGVLFFTTTAGGVKNWYCSGSTVNSNGKDVVFTSGECLYGSLYGAAPGETWHTNVEFVPDYSAGAGYPEDPYGAWTARQLFTLTNYVNSQDFGDDIGAAVMNTNGARQHIVNVVGGQGIAWNYSPTFSVADFGYPGTGILQDCAGSEFNWSAYVSSTMGLACPFLNAGGGPWLASFGGEFGYVNGVNAFGYSSLPSYVFSPYFGTNAANLYNAAANL